MESHVKKNLETIESELVGSKARLLVVTKTFSPERIMEAYESGYRAFGENKVQELLEKKEKLPTDIEWHLIGHLQTNKVKYIAPFIHCIQSVDSEKLLEEIEKQAKKNGRRIQVLLQVYIAKEDTKSGWDPLELEAWFADKGPSRFPSLDFAGFMGMASFSTDWELVRSEFRQLRQWQEAWSEQFSFPNVELKELSMGMSGDFRIAVEEGSTMIRMGSAVFGPRYYPSKA